MGAVLCSDLHATELRISPDPATVGVNELDSPVINLPAGTWQLSFRHNYSLESTFDGGVLEIKISNGSWTDVVTAGGQFLSGPYNATLSTSYNNPLGGRSAWSGTSSAFVSTTLKLPGAAAGQQVQFRWRCGSDSSVSKTGWYLDSVALTSSGLQCTVPPPVLFSPSFSGNTTFLTWSAVSQRTYEVQYRTNLTLGGCSLLTTVIATNSTASASDVSPPDPQRYYRVVLLP
jgi:hypothetical protein